MTQNTPNQWKALRMAAGISQREAERRMGWEKSGRLSWIERGLETTPEQERDLRKLYGGILLGDPAANIAEVAKTA